MTLLAEYETAIKNEQQHFNIINNIAGQVKEFPFSGRPGGQVQTVLLNSNHSGWHCKSKKVSQNPIC